MKLADVVFDDFPRPIKLADVAFDDLPASAERKAAMKAAMAADTDDDDAFDTYQAAIFDQMIPLIDRIDKLPGPDYAEIDAATTEVLHISATDTSHVVTSGACTTFVAGLDELRCVCGHSKEKHR